MRTFSTGLHPVDPKGGEMARYCIARNGPALYLDCQECTEKLCEYFFCLVVGSRNFSDYEFMKKKLDHLLKNQPNVVIVSGGARGADFLAERYAKEKGYPLKVFPANWNALGKSAGYIRNEEMHSYISKAEKRGCVAFWDGKSKGTKHNFELVKKYNNPLRVIRYQ